MAATPHINFTSLKDIQDEDEQKDARKTLNDNAQIIDVKRLIELKSGKVIFEESNVMYSFCFSLKEVSFCLQ